MKKFLGFIICILISIGILYLSLIADTINCAKSTGKCVFQSKIRFTNIELNKENFSIEDLQNVRCTREYQPSRRGKKSYYILQLDFNDRTYNIASYGKLKACRYDTQNIRKYLHSNEDKLSLNSPAGFLNTLGIIFSIIFLIVGIIILKDQPTQEKDFEDEDE